MSTARACQQCRTAKGTSLICRKQQELTHAVRCDRGQPSCSRCRRRGLTCVGASAETEYIFRDETEVARRNSRRARGEGSTTLQLEVAPAGQLPYARSPQEYTELVSLQLQYPWLNERALATLPEPLKRDIDSRAVDRFFLDWILYPSRDGASPGFLHTLPILFRGVADGSVLYHAVRALAFADLGQGRNGEGVSFTRKARRSYGEALSQMRTVAATGDDLTSDQIFAALLLIDSFEAMYLNTQEEPLGLHSEAFKYVMNARGTEQLLDPSRFALWRLANCRLQARQIHNREEPDPAQVELLSKLNLDRPDLHITSDISRMTTLCAAAKGLLDGMSSMSLQSSVPEFDAEETTRLFEAMQTLINGIDQWTSSVTGAWKATTFDSARLLRFGEVDYHLDHPLAHFYCSEVLSYTDVWIAYIWNFHAASQIVLREYLIDVWELRAQFQSWEPELGDLDRTESEKGAVRRLATDILRSFPPLVGFSDASGERLGQRLQGKVAGRYLALFAMDVITKAQFTSRAQKNTASKLTDWIYASHALA